MTRPLRVMLSSRCLDKVNFEDGTILLSELRTELKLELERETLLGELTFEVWINEDAPPAAGDSTTWEHCLLQAETAEIFVALYNEGAGWAQHDGDIGICHAELETALKTGRAKVRLVSVPGKGGKRSAADALFQDFISGQSLFRGGTVKTRVDAKKRVLEAVRDAVLGLARRGRTHSRKDRYDRGQALEWSRLSFAGRKSVMEVTLMDALRGRDGSLVSDQLAALTIARKQVLLQVSAIPGPVGTAEARELVGRPHLHDHRLEATLTTEACVGPLHLIACHRNVTEKQALSILGLPDAITVSSGFGVYVADSVQKAQLVLLADCRDPGATRHAAQLFFDWLEHSGEAEELETRAIARRRIVKALAKEQT